MKKIVMMSLVMAMSACAPSNKGTSVQRMAKSGDGQKGLVSGEVPTTELSKLEKDAKGKVTKANCVDLKAFSSSLTESPNQSFVVTTQLIDVAEAAQFQDLVEGKVAGGNDALLSQLLKQAADQKDESLLPRREVLTMAQIQKLGPELSIINQEACGSVALQSTDENNNMATYKVVNPSGNAISIENESGTVRYRYLLGRSNFDFRIERIQLVNLEHCGQSKEVFVRVATNYLAVDKASQSNKVDMAFFNQLLGLVDGAADYRPPMVDASVQNKKAASPAVKASSMATVRKDNTVNTNSLDWLYAQVAAGLIKTEACQKEDKNQKE